MAELTTKERLQPSLLDRLTDDEPDKKQESRDQRVLNLQKLRAGVIRDLSWLLNTCNLAATEDLESWDEIASSVLNFGMPDLTGKSVAGVDIRALEEMVRKTIWDFEPRILRKSVKVTAVVGEGEMDHNALSFEIEGELWAQPVPLRMFLKTEIDLETGYVSIAESAS
jgi:type VI secretion system protein ImpF